MYRMRGQSPKKQEEWKNKPSERDRQIAGPIAWPADVNSGRCVHVSGAAGIPGSARKTHLGRYIEFLGALD